MFKQPSKAVTIEDVEPPREGLDGFLSAEWKAFDEARILARAAAKNRADPVFRAQQPAPDEIARTEAAEREVAAAQRALDELVAAQVAGVPTYANGSASQVGVFIDQNADWHELNNLVEAAIGRRSRVRAEISAAQMRRYEQARKDP